MSLDKAHGPIYIPGPFILTVVFFFFLIKKYKYNAYIIGTLILR